MSAQWNHRIVKRKSSDGERDVFAVHEVHYNEQMEEIAITRDPSPFLGSSLEELKTTLIRILHSATLPTLNYEDFDKFKKSVYLTGGNNVDDNGDH